MKIADVMRKELMLLPAQATNKEDILDEMVQQLVDTGAVNDFDVFRKGIADREESMSVMALRCRMRKTKRLKKHLSSLRNNPLV